jgi:hypothetical protein
VEENKAYTTALGENIMSDQNYKGMHLWQADFGSIEPKLLILTKTEDFILAVRRAKLAAKEQFIKSKLVQLKHTGTIDA